MTTPPWPDLPGEITLRMLDHADLASRNLVAVVAEHRLGSYRAAGWAPVTAETLDDLAPNRLQRYLIAGLDRHIRPWVYPDQWRLPRIDLFPRTASLAAAVRRASGRWSR